MVLDVVTHTFFTGGMDDQNQLQKCSAVCRDGQPCQAWAIRDSEPALCSVHAGRNEGGGGQPGNQNALKHGYYAKAIRPESLPIEKMQDLALFGELVMGRYVLGELAAYLVREDVPAEKKLSVVPLINSTIRTVVYVAKHIKKDPFDWDEVLDELGEEWGMDL